MEIRVKYLVALLLVFMSVACAKDDLYEDDFGQAEVVDENVVELRFGIPSTRATLDENLNLRWQSGDRINFMVYDGSTQLFRKDASFWSNMVDNSSEGYSQAYFKAKFDAEADATVLASIEAMVDGKCYAVSPSKGVTISDTKATMTIPSLQTGEYSSAYDFMTARSEAISGLKLSDGQSDDYVNNIDLTFAHHTHAFRVAIPGNNLGKEITKAYLKFPFAVVGDVTADFTTGDVTTSNTSDLVIVEFAKPKTAGDEFWVFINGIENKGKVDIRFQAADGTFTERRIANFTQQNWSAGRISKIRMSVPQAATYTTVSYVVADYSQLGEPVEILHMTLPEGYYFTDYKQRNTATALENGEYEFGLFGDMLDDSLTEGSITMEFESEHALVPSAVKFADTELKAPYLFAEDFSSIKSYSRDIVTGAQGTAVTAYDLSESTYGLSAGWTGARTGGQEGTSIRVGSRVDRVWGYTHTYGRLDSPALKNIKSGVSVNVVVSFNYSGGRDGDSGYSPRAVCGYTTTAGLINGKTGSFSADADNWENIQGTQLVPSISTSGSYSSVTQSTSYTIADCQSSFRLSWMIRATGEGGFISNGNQWMFIDNIKVTIVQ